MDALKAAIETMIAEQTWESFLAAIKAALAVVFGFIAEEV